MTAPALRAAATPHTKAVSARGVAAIWAGESLHVPSWAPLGLPIQRESKVDREIPLGFRDSRLRRYDRNLRYAKPLGPLRDTSY